MRLQPTRIPGISTLHQTFKKRIGEKALQPLAQRCQRAIAIKRLRVRNPPLTHKGPERRIRQGTTGIQQPATTGLNPIRPATKNGQPRLAVLLFGLPRVAVGVFEAIEMMLERAIVASDQFLNLALVLGAVLATPIAGIGLGQSPLHHRQAFVDDRAISEHQHRHGSLGREREHLGRLGLERHFPPLHDHPGLQQRPAGAHRVRTPPKAVEHRSPCHPRASSNCR